MDKRLKEIRWKLMDMAQQEATQLFRLARRSQRHGCKRETVEKIRTEARWLHEVGVTCPERLIDFDFEYKFHYAFKIGG